MTARRQLRLGLIGFGEVGYNLAKGLTGEGLIAITALARAGGASSDLARTRAAASGVALVADPAALASQSDIILGLTQGSRSLASADALAPHVGRGHVYVDLASATPRVKTDVAARLRDSGVAFADGSIMGGPLLDGHKVEILASGPAAPLFHDAMAPWGMTIRVVGPETGAASAIKIFRSVIAKGLEALLIECLLATEPYGITDEVLWSYSRFLAPQPSKDKPSTDMAFKHMATFLVRTDVIHAARRAEEAVMSAEALHDAGVDPVMTRATVARLSAVAALGLREAFSGTPPVHHAEAIAAIAAGLRASGAEPDPSA